MSQVVNLDDGRCTVVSKSINKTVFKLKSTINQSNELIKIYNIAKIDKSSLSKYMDYKILIHPHVMFSLSRISNTDLIITRNYLMPLKEYKQFKNQYMDNISLISDICDSVEYLHSNQAIHGNISMNNIMMDVNTNDVYLVDPFQYLLLTKQIDLHSYHSIHNLSPEMLNCSCLNQKSIESDIWSLGCVIFEIFTGISPFNNKDILSLYRSIIRCEYQHIYLKNIYNGEINELLKRIFQPYPELRPSVSEIKKIINKYKKIQIYSNNKSIIINSELSKICITHNPTYPSHIYDDDCHFIQSIKHLSNELKYYNSLIELKLINCINNKTLKYISNIFQYLSTLQILCFEYEIEKDIDKEINYNYGNQLSYDSINCFSKNIRYLPNLQYLNLNNNSIDDYSASLILKNLSFNTNLKSLHLRSLFVSILSLTEFNKVASCLVNLEYLDLSNTDITSTEIPLLSQVIKQIKSLEYLNLSDSLIGNNYEMLYQSFTYCNSLKCLKLKNCYIDNMSLQCLSTCFIHLPSLETLTLEWNFFNENCFSCLVSHFSCITNLKSFNFSANPLNEESYKLFGDNMKYISKLEKLKLAVDYYNDDGLISLSNSFSYITNLKVLLLRNNSFSLKGMKVFSNNLKYITQLERLNIAETMLDGSDVMDELSNNLKYISNIKHLNISSNHIGKIGIKTFCKSATDLIHLETLNLENNQINRDCRYDLMGFITKLQKLKHFNLSKNPINSINLQGINQLQIIQLESSKKASDLLTFINDINSLSNHKNIIHFNLNGNKIDRTYFGYNMLIKRIIHSFEHIKTIGFKMNLENVKFNSVLVLEFGRVLRFIPHLQYLNLASNSFKDNDINVISPNIKYISNLEELSIKNNKITCNGLSNLANQFSYLQNLNTFDLSHNPLNMKSAKNVDNIISHFSCVTRLKDLNISNCKLDDCDKMDKLSNYFCYLSHIIILRMGNNNFSKNTKLFYENIGLLSILHTIDLNNVECDDNSLITFSKNFSRLNYLNELNLSNNNITNVGINEMVKYISQISLLTSLSLSSNKINDEGIISLSKELSSVRNLIKIYIDDINMTSVGMKYFSESLKYLPHLNTLYIQQNPIDNSGIVEFSHNCQYICNLENLYCYNNNIGDYGIIEFSKFISHLYNLKILNMSGNMISNGVESLSEQLKYTPNIKSLDFSSNNISNQGVISLCNNLSHLKYLNRLCLDDNSYDDKLDWFRNVKKTHPNLIIKKN